MYNYNGFGLSISSDIAFPELAEAEFVTADVTITLGEVPDQSNGNAKNYLLHDQEFFWDLDKICKYRALTGSRVIVQPIKGANHRTVRAHLLGTVMAVVLHQRGCIPLHASAININDKLTLITGDSGAGKSTTVSGLLKKGYRIFADDVVVAREENSTTVVASSSYPMIKLWDDAIGKLDDDRFNNRTFAIAQDINKYGIFFHNQFDKASYSIERVFVLALKDEGAIETIRVTDGEAFNAIKNQSYRAEFIHTRYLMELNFKMLTNLARQAEVIQICRPRNCKPEDLVNAVESYF